MEKVDYKNGSVAQYAASDRYGCQHGGQVDW